MFFDFRMAVVPQQDADAALVEGRPRRRLYTLTAAGAARLAARFPDRWRAEVTDTIRATAERGLALTAAEHVEALDALQAWRCDVTANWGDYDALLIPTGAAPAWKAEDEAPPGLTPATQGMFCGWVNAAGLAAISVPGLPHPDGRPIGVQLVALPKNLATLGITWQATEKFRAYGEARYIGAMSIDTTSVAGTVFAQGGNMVYSASANYAWGRRTDIIAGVVNIANRLYSENGYTFNQPFNRTLSLPRTVNLAVKFRF
jgi:outer membrane receptor protein involved in Fe transport